MKKTFTFYDLILKKRLLGLVFLLLLCNKNFAQTFCRPTSNTSSIGGVCLGTTEITNPTLAYDASVSTYATLTNALGVLCFAQETVTFDQTAKAGDQIVIYYGSNSPLLDVGLLSNSSIQAINSTAGTSGPVVALNSSLLNIQLLSGNTTGVIRYTLTADANQVKIQVGGLVSLLSNLRVYDVRLQFAKPTITNGETQSVCTGQSVTLTATAAAGTTVAWYDMPTATTALSTTANYTTPALTATTTYYVSTSRVGGCESSERLPVTINVIEPTIPTISTTGTAICSTGATQATTLSVVNPVPGTIYSWFNVATGGAALTTGTTYTPTVPTGATNFYVEAAIGTCKSARTQVTVTSTPVPAQATVLTQSVSILSGQNATLNASAAAGVTLDWYDVATGGTKLLGDSNSFTTPILTASKTYYVESRSIVGGCLSVARVPIVVTVLPNALGTCLEANSQQTTQNGLCLLCSSTTPNNSVDGNSGTSAILSLPVAAINGYIQQTLQFNNPGKAGDIVDVELALPGGIADLSLLGVVSLATYNGATYNNDRVFINNSLVTLQLLSGNRFRASVVAGANFDRVEIRLGGLVSALTNLEIYQATYRYKATTITGNVNICGGQTTTLLANLAVGETVNWYSAATGGTLLASTAAYTTPALSVNTTYYTEVTRNGCVNSERSPVLVTVSNPVAPIIDVSPTTICSGNGTTLSVQTPIAGTTYRWYDALTGGNLVFTGTSFVTPALTANTSYFVEASIGTCSATRTPVNLTVSTPPAPPVPTSSNVTIQTGQTVTLSVATNPGIAYEWFDVPTGGTALLTNSSTYTPSPALTANKTFYVQARDLTSDCTSSTRAAIMVNVINTVSGCLQGASQVISTDGLLCIGCTSTNPGNSVDGNINTSATLFVPVAAAGAYNQQLITFASAGHAGDIIEVELELSTGLADVSILGGISLATYNGVTFNNDRRLLTNNLLSLQLLSGNKFKATFNATAIFDKVEVRIGQGLATLLTTLNIYEASYRFPDAIITGAAAPVCAGGTATLTATSPGLGGEVYAWYDSPIGGSIAAVNPTVALNATTTYYVQATRGGTCINSVRQPVTINVLSIPTAADIAITSPLTASCAGGIVLAPTSALAGATFKYYTDANKTQPISNGTVGTVTYSIDGTTGALTISGLSAANAPYTYYVSVLNGGTCENLAGTLKSVVVDYPAGSVLTVKDLSACAKANLKDAITNFDTSGNTTYTFFDSASNPITDQAASNILVGGNFFIQAQTTGVACPSAKLPVAVTVNPLPTLTGVTSSIAVTKGSSVTLNATSNGTITWYDPQGNALPSNNTGPLNTVGIFTYTVVASNGNCTQSQTITISVIDPASCDSLLERVYANSELSGTIITGSVTDGPLAVDGDPSTFSTINAGLGLLGIGTTWQNLQWPTTIPKGTPVTVKIGLANSLLAVGQNISVIGTKRDVSNNPIDIGTLQSVSGSLLNLLPGQNSFEYTFVPSNTSGLQDYDGIRVQLGSIASVAQNINIYDAYYKKQVTQIACGQGDIEDVFSGVKDLGVGALTATVGVSNPWNIADGDVATYATMFSGAGVLAAAELTTTFRTPSMVGDSLRITISKPGTLLNLNLLTGFTIQLYSGNIAVGAPIQNNSSLLTLKLLSGDTMAMTLIAPQTEPYDKVVITFGGVASVLDQLRVHTIDRVTNTKVIGGDLTNKVTVCPGSTITLSAPTKSCASYAWYDSPTGGNLLSSGDGQSYTLPATLAAGIYKYYIQPIRYGCAALERGEVTVVVRATAPAAAVASVTINGGTNTIVCSESGTVTLDAILNATPVLTNPVYHWYSFDGTTSQPIIGETTSKLILTGLAPGTYTYYVGVSSDEFCETAPADRKQVTFTILPTSLSTDIAVDNATICHDTAAVLTPSNTNTTLTNPVFFWYLDANKTQPVTNGAIINGVTYTVSGTGVLTASGLTTAMSPISYYVALSSDFTCQNKNGELKVATVMINDPATPTSIVYDQKFCLANNPTVANIQVNEANVVWYTLATGGTALDPTTPLTNAIYYGAIKDGSGCESSVRSIVTVTVTDPATPSTNDNTQDFCLVNKPTVANLQTNETNVVWYNLSAGGTALDPTTALANGPYYAALKDATTGCESSSRLLVTVTITDPLTPTTNDDTQEFCLVNKPTVANLQTNENNVVWYNLSAGGTALDPTTALANGTYYAALKDATTSCESSVRLLVTVTVTDPAKASTNDDTQDFCLANNPTVANLQTNETNVVWYNLSAGGSALDPTTPLVNGSYYATLKDALTGCESSVRLLVTVTVTDPGTPTLVTAGTQNFCVVNAPTFASVQFTQANIVWYTALTGGTAIASTTALTSGVYFAAIKDPTTGCESAGRLQVTISVTDPATPTSTSLSQVFCSGNNPTVANIQTNESNVVWYRAANGGTAVASTTALVSGDYFAVLKDATTACESSVRLKVTVTVGNTINPTTTNTAQNFCSTNNPTVANIQVNETNVSWFNSATGGTAIPATTALTSGTYYGDIIDPTTGCASSTRLLVTVTIVNPMATPTTNATTQNFCTVNTPKVSNIQVNESNVIWYATATGGTAIPSTTNLATGIYYGAIASGSGCENPARLAVQVNVNAPGVITTTKTAQTFCQSAAPTIENISVNETNVVWYTSATGGTPLPANTPLTTATYYAGALSNTTNGCESASRLAIAVSFENDAMVPITTSDNTPCVFQGVTYSIANGKSNYVWSVTNGTIVTGGGTADGSVVISWNDIGPGKVTVAYTNICDERTTKTLNVTVASCSDLTITNTVSNPTPNFGDQITFTITVNNVGEGNFINTIVSDLLPSGYNLVSSNTSTGTYDPLTGLWTIPALNAGQSVVLTIVAEVLPSGDYLNVATVEISTPLDVDASNNSASAVVVPICLTVYNEFTPNNDGANDLFRIDCIESYPNNELKVYNRYGALVYSKQHYENDWNGTANVSGVINRGDMLPTGTYFYVITIGDGTVKKGWLSIMR
jgi:gliding motility-associated-like protein/uncharacterized repeat protein (TIGR01451 family)